MIRSSKSHWFMRALALVVLLAAAPLALSKRGVAMNEACGSPQTGSCCPYNALCCVNGICYAGYDWHSGGGCHPA